MRATNTATPRRAVPQLRAQQTRRAGSRGVAASVVLAWAACAPGGSGVPSDSAYVDVLARLVASRVEIPADDSAGLDSARRTIMAAFGLAPDDLRRYAERHGSDPEHMEAIWEAISRKAVYLDSLRSAPAEELEKDSARSDPAEEPVKDSLEAVEAGG